MQVDLQFQRAETENVQEKRAPLPNPVRARRHENVGLQKMGPRGGRGAGPVGASGLEPAKPPSAQHTLSVPDTRPRAPQPPPLRGPPPVPPPRPWATVTCASEARTPLHRASRPQLGTELHSPQYSPQNSQPPQERVQTRRARREEGPLVSIGCC